MLKIIKGDKMKKLEDEVNKMKKRLDFHSKEMNVLAGHIVKNKDHIAESQSVLLGILGETQKEPKEEKKKDDVMCQ